MKAENFQRIQELMRTRATLSDRLKVIEKPSLVEQVKGEIADIDTELGKL